MPLHYPEHEAIARFGNRRSTRPRSAATPCPRFRGRLVEDGTLSAEEADEIAERVRAEMQEAVDFALASPFPTAEEAVEYVYA